MDYVKPAQVVESLASAGEMKSKLPVRHLLLRGALSGALFVGAIFHATYSEKRAPETVATAEEFIPRLIDQDELEQPVVT